MPPRLSGETPLREMRNRGFAALSQIDTELRIRGIDDPGIIANIIALDSILRDLAHAAAPAIRAAERAAEEYHQLREDLEDQYTRP